MDDKNTQEHNQHVPLEPGRMLTHQNPLMNFARTPAIYISLPSCGHFSQPGDYELSDSNELGVSAMTTADELILKTPDALLNGEAMIKIIQSCVPRIKNVYNLSAPDVDAILLAIRMASYGDEMEFHAACPECETSKHFAISITDSLDRIEFLKPEYIVTLANDIKISLKPYTYQSGIKQSLMAFNEAKIMKAVLSDDLENPEVSRQYKESFMKMAELLTELTADSIIALWDPDGNYMEVTPEQIIEWLNNIPRADADLIQKELIKINQTGVLRTAKVVCDNEECKHEWESELTFDASNFFE